MKNLVLLACLAFVSTQVQAASYQISDLRPFKGKYATTSQDCPMLGNISPKRAYVSINTQSGVSTVEIKVYGDDAAILEILALDGTRQSPGTATNIHGKVTDAWTSKLVTLENQLGGLQLTTNVVTQSPRGRNEAKYRLELVYNNRLVYSRTINGQTDYCRFTASK